MVSSHDSSAPAAARMARLRAALDFLAAHHVMSLSLVGDGAPHACSLMYIHDGFTLSWVSDPDTRHSRIIHGAPEGGAPAAVTIAPDYDDFRVLRGLQMVGKASPAGVLDSAAALLPFAKRYAFFSGEKPAALMAAMAKARVYRFSPKSLTFIDNTAGFGTKDCFVGAELEQP